MKYSMNGERRLVGQRVTVNVNGASISGTLCSSGNHGVVLDVNGSKRTFSGHASVRPVDLSAA